jgi:hypothetical protein
MTLWQWSEWQIGPQDVPYEEESLAVQQPHISPLTGFQQVTTKIPPSYDGRTSWFSYEEAVDDWCDITELEPAKHGPALRNRLEGDAAIYKTLLDRDALKDPNAGVAYFKAQLRPHFVKGSQSVFLWRFFQLLRASRGSQDMLRWIGRMSVLRKRTQEAWMDMFTEVNDQDAGFQAAFNIALAAIQRDRPAPDPVAALRDFNVARRNVHQQAFPLNENLFALVVTVLADLEESQRERLSSTMTLRGIDVPQYTFDNLRTVFIELFCAPRSSLENPMYRPSRSQRTFCVMEQGELEGDSGYWAEDEESGEVGFVPEYDEIFSQDE